MAAAGASVRSARRSAACRDRALLLANDVAEAVNAVKPGRLIGMYAYSEHLRRRRPSQAHPQVVISVATGFIRGGHAIDQLISGWQAKAKTLGIREYYSVNTWDRDLPGAARGGTSSICARPSRTSIKAARASCRRNRASNFGPNGLGYLSCCAHDAGREGGAEDRSAHRRLPRQILWASACSQWRSFMHCWMARGAKRSATTCSAGCFDF